MLRFRYSDNILNHQPNMEKMIYKKAFSIRDVQHHSKKFTNAGSRAKNNFESSRRRWKTERRRNQINSAKSATRQLIKHYHQGEKLN